MLSTHLVEGVGAGGSRVRVLRALRVRVKVRVRAATTLDQRTGQRMRHSRSHSQR